MSDRAQTEPGYGRPQTEPGQPHRCPFNDLLIEGFGADGKRGRVGAMEKRMKKFEIEIAGVRSIQLKLIVWVCVAAGGSTAAATTAFKLFAG